MLRLWGPNTCVLLSARAVNGQLRKVSQQPLGAGHSERAKLEPFQWFAGGLTTLIGGGILNLLYTLHQDKKTENRVKHVIESSTVFPAEPYHVPRVQLEDELKKCILKDIDGVNKVVNISGNRQAGKTEMLRRVLQGRSGVVTITLSQEGKDIDDVLVQVMKANNIAEVQEAFLKTKDSTGQIPIIVVDIPKHQTDCAVIRGVSNFAKEWGPEYKRAKVIVITSTAAASLAITADDRLYRFFVPPFSREEFCESDEVEKWLADQGAIQASHDPQQRAHIKATLFYLTGGNIGRSKDLCGMIATEGLDKAKQNYMKILKKDVLAYQTVDQHGGFGGVSAAAQLAAAVAKAEYGCGCSEEDDACEGKFTPRDFAEAVRNRDAHPIYFNPITSCYVAASPAVHDLLRLSLQTSS